MRPTNVGELGPGEERVIELREEELVAKKEQRDVGEIIVRTAIDTVPGRLEVDALREEVAVEHEPVAQVVSERQEPWEQDGVLIIPVYEEQLVVTKRLILRERVRVRRIQTTERQLFEDTLRRDHLIIEDPQNTGVVHETRPTDDESSDASDGPERDEGSGAHDGFLTRLVTRALE